MKQIFIGIDPGVTGAIAWIWPGDSVRVYKMPDIAGLFEFSELWRDSWQLCDTHCVIEQVHSSPQQGVSGAFTFGRSYGQLEMFAVSTFKHVHYIRPLAWQSALNCRTKGDKTISLERARLLFPSIDNLSIRTADALLLAYYGFKKYGRKDSTAD